MHHRLHVPRGMVEPGAGGQVDAGAPAGSHAVVAPLPQLRHHEASEGPAPPVTSIRMRAILQAGGTHA